MTLEIVLAGIAGAAWGYASDRIAARWPAHEDGSIRARDWRTILVVLVGALAGAATVTRFAADPVHLLVIGAYVVALVLLFATDLDQRLLPDVITLPMIPYALVVTRRISMHSYVPYGPFLIAGSLWAILALSPP